MLTIEEIKQFHKKMEIVSQTQKDSIKTNILHHMRVRWNFFIIEQT